MKKIITIFSAILALVLCTSLMACNTAPATNEPGETNPAATTPQETEPIETDPAETDPVDTEPADTEPVETEPVDPPATADITYEQDGSGNYVITGFVAEDMTEIVIPAEIDGIKITKVADALFEGNTDITSVVIEEGIEIIGCSSFARCTSLVSVVLPNTLTQIIASAFEDCANLTTLAIPDSVTSIDMWAFRGCDKLLEEVDGVKYLGKWAIVISDFERAEIAIRPGTVGVASYFKGNGTDPDPAAIILDIPEGVKYVGISAFNSVEAAITIPSTLEIVGNNAFANTPNMPATVELISVKEIGLKAFMNSTAIQKVVLGHNVETVSMLKMRPNGMVGPFWDCTSLSEVVLMSGNSAEEEYFLGTGGPEITFIYPETE